MSGRKKISKKNKKMVNTIMTNPDCKNKEFDKEVADKWYKCVCGVVQEFYKEDKHVFL